MLKLAMLSLSLRNADNIKWNLSCIQYQSLPDRSAMLARAVAKLYQLTSVLSSVVRLNVFCNTGSCVMMSWYVFSYFDCMIEIIFMMSQCALYVYAWRQMYDNKQSWILKYWINIDKISCMNNYIQFKQHHIIIHPWRNLSNGIQELLCPTFNRYSDYIDVYALIPVKPC